MSKYQKIINEYNRVGTLTKALERLPDIKHANLEVEETTSGDIMVFIYIEQPGSLTYTIFVDILLDSFDLRVYNLDGEIQLSTLRLIEKVIKEFIEPEEVQLTTESSI